jgi:vacuolar-type H+-ATPase subunit C/Vma6
LRALAGARRDARRGELVEYVQQAIDLENTVTAVAITGQKDVVPKDLFLPGGKRIDIGVFETAAGRPDGRDAALILAAAFAGAPFAAVLRAARPATEPWEDALLRARVAALRREVRRHPLGPAMALYFALRLRVETTDLSRAIWGIALGAPPHVLAGALLAAP